MIQALNKKIKASEFFNVFKKTPQILRNINYKDNNVLKKKTVIATIKMIEKKIKGRGRILVRKSGTEPKIRIMGESEDILLLKKCLKIIIEKIN